MCELFTGLSAFPLTPLRDQRPDETAFTRLVERLVAAGVDSIGVLGSTGNYAYLSRDERARIANLACATRGDIPVVIGIGALRTDDVLAHAEDAQRAGAAGLLLPPMAYQPLREAEVFALYQRVSAAASVPICVYDNPTTTGFIFSDALHADIAALPGIGSIKIPPMAGDEDTVAARVAALRQRLPSHVTIGISGDPVAARALNAGCEAWYSVLGGLFPDTAMAITQAAREGNTAEAEALSARLDPLWQLYRDHGGSLRVIATAAERLRHVATPCLPHPLHSLDGEARRAVDHVLATLDLA